MAQDLFARDVRHYAFVSWTWQARDSKLSVLSARHRDACRRPSTHHDDHELATEARDAGFGAVVA